MTPRPTPEYRFIPRIVNPIRMRRALVFAADALVRESGKVLEAEMPWLRTEVLTDLRSARTASFDEPSVFLFDDTGLALLDARRLRAANRDSIFVLLTFQPYIQCAPPRAAREKYPYSAGADLVFAVNRHEFPPERIVLAAARAAEDLLNVRRRSGLKRFIFHVVDDEPRWLSQFLPVLYAIIGQRADVMISRTYEQSLRFLFGVEEESGIGGRGGRARGHGDDVVCLIADIFFPKGEDLQSDAGLGPFEDVVVEEGLPVRGDDLLALRLGRHDPLRRTRGPS